MGGIDALPTQNWFNTSLEGSSNINSQVYGFQIRCTEALLSGGCYPPWPSLPQISVSGVELAGTENSAPYVSGQGPLWTTGSWVWNPPDDPWPVTLYASDVSGICSSEATVEDSS